MLKHMLGLAAVAAIVVGGLPVASAQEHKITLGSVGPPSSVAYLLPLIDHYGLAKQHQIDLTNAMTSDPGTLYTDFAARRLLVTVGGFSNAANFYVRGLKMKLLFTLVIANHEVVAKGDIRTPADLKGKKLAATTSSGFYALVQIYLRHNGLDPRSNLEVRSGPLPAVQSQLLAGQVDAGVLWDPLLSSMLGKGYHPVGNMSEDIRKDLNLAPNAPIWFIGVFAWEDWVNESPQRVQALMAMFQDAAAIYETKPDEADPLISAFTKVPLDALKSSRVRDPHTFRVLPAIDEKASLNALIRGYQSIGFIPSIPDDGLYYTWPGLKR